MKNALIIFTKNPEKGKVKTRLAATLGNKNAFAIYRKLVSHTLEVSRKANADKFVFYSSHIDDHDLWDKDDFEKRLQQGNDLGQRMYNAFKEIFDHGYEIVTIIGTDCPGITAPIIEEAFSALEHSDIVIGPAKDGGYYLLGSRKPIEALFNNISWSTDKVLVQTLEACNVLKLSIHLLGELSDIDVADDLTDLKGFLSFNP